MRIDAGSSFGVFDSIARSAATSAARSASRPEVETSAPAQEKSAAQGVDFTHMTRQELFDWMNGELAAGRMTFEASSPFLAMTIKISATTGEQVDMARDETRINFVERMRQGIAGARWRQDDQEAERLEVALARMLREQGGLDLAA